MKSSLFLFKIFILAIIIFVSGCSTYQIKTKSELKKQEEKGPIRALTLDSCLYTLEEFSFSDSLLTGRGTLKKDGKKTKFTGSVPFNRIVFIEGRTMNYWKALWIVPMAASVTSGLFQFYNILKSK